MADKWEKQSGATTGNGGLSWFLPSLIVSLMIGVFVLVLMNERSSYGEVDREETETSLIPKAKFRSASRENLSGDSVIDMLEDNVFYDLDWNNTALGFPNDYKLLNDGKVVLDHASGLMWQQSGSAKDISYNEARKYVAQLNSGQYAGYNNWRLPTLEEAMSLMEPIEKNSGLHVDPVFDTTQRWIWTSDLNNTSLAWLVNFVSGNCYTYVNDYFDFASGGYVRAVR